MNYFIDLLSLTLASVGVITGGITLNPIVLGVLTTSGVLLKAYAEMKNYKGKIDFIKFGFTTYEKIFTNLRLAMRGDELNYNNLFLKLKY